MKPQAILIGGKWIPFNDISTPEDGWVSVTGNERFLTVKVRESAIDAVKYLNTPDQPCVERFEVG